MAFIPYADNEPLEVKLAEVYEHIRGDRGIIPNILRIHADNPPALDGHFNLYQALMFKRSELSRTQREMIAVVVSQINECHY